MFADVVGSTALYEELGDSDAKQRIAECLTVAKNLIEEHSGEVLIELGDEVMAVFDEAGDAAAAACQIHETISETFPVEDDGRALRMRIGVHVGPVAGHEDDLMEETAKIAHWATSHAKPEQTLATDAVIKALPRIYQAVSRYVDDETWSFISIEHMAVHEIVWDVEGATTYAGEVPPPNSKKCRGIIFTCYGKSVVLDAERPVISIGRGSSNDLVVHHELASRQHLNAQFSRGRCTITDNSTNGTVIYLDDDSESHDLRRDSYTITGSGKLVLGRPAEVEEKDRVEFYSLSAT